MEEDATVSNCRKTKNLKIDANRGPGKISFEIVKNNNFKIKDTVGTGKVS